MIPPQEQEQIKKVCEEIKEANGWVTMYVEYCISPSTPYLLRDCNGETICMGETSEDAIIKGVGIQQAQIRAICEE